MAKAVFFDLYETLITERKNGRKALDFGTPECDSPASVLGMSEEIFEREWAARRPGRMTGLFSDYYAVIQDMCCQLNLDVANDVLRSLNQQRLAAKQVPYRNIDQRVLDMLQGLKTKGLKIGLISNCSAEETDGLSLCPLAAFMDEIVLSCEVGVSKPNKEIYLIACNRLGVEPSDSIFIGDGGANELLGAKNVGMRAFRASWFVNRVSSPEDFLPIVDPIAVIDLIS